MRNLVLETYSHHQHLYSEQSPGSFFFFFFFFAGGGGVQKSVFIVNSNPYLPTPLNLL